MEGTGIFSLAGGVLLAPIQLAFYLAGTGRRLLLAHAQRRRMLSPHEINLRRASHPLGLFAVLLALWWLEGSHAAHARAVIGVNSWILAVLAGVVFVFAAASFVAGVHRCAGLPDSLLATRAVFKLAASAVICAYVWRLPLWRAYLDAALFPYLAPPVFLIGLWCAVTATVRLLLLTVPMSGALATIRKILRRRNAPLRPARRRRFWFF
jgi:hypothetical protein